MSIFRSTDYRDYLKQVLLKLPKKGYGELSRMAKAIGIHQTLMSLILSGERDLSLEQGYDLAQYLGLTELETEYFSLLIQYQRAGNKRFKDSIHKKIEKLKNESLLIAKRNDREKTLSDHERTVIYSSWIYSAIRMYTSVDEKGVTLEDVQKKFQLTRQRTLEILNFLEGGGVVVQEKGLYLMGTQRTFLEQGSPHLLKHHSNWRIKSLHQADNLSDKELMFTSPVSLSKNDFDKLREELATFIKMFLKTVADSPAEDIACLNIDFFWIK